MEHQSILVFTLLFFYNIQTSVGAPGDILISKSPDLISGPEDGSTVKARCGALIDDSKEKTTFKLASNRNFNFRRCVNSVDVSGQGIQDRIDLNCYKINGKITSIATDKFLAYDNPSQRLRLFTNTPGTLTVVQDGVCTKRSYTIEKAIHYYQSSEMSIEECRKANKDMEEAVKEWKINFEKEMKERYPDCYPFCGANEPEGVKDQDKDGGTGNKGDKGGAADNKNGKDDSDEWNF